MRQLALELSARPEPSFSNFVPGRNAELFAALRALACAGGGERFIYIWGAPGSGRSHLLQAVLREARLAGRHAIHLKARSGGGMLAAAGLDALVAVQDVELLDAADQIALFNVYNRLREGSGALVASGIAAPGAIGVRPDLGTRLAWGLVYEVHGLSDDEKSVAMAAHAQGRGFVLPEEVRSYLLRRGRRDLPSLLALVDLLDRRSLETHRAITLPLVREVLASAAVTTERQ